MNDKERGAVLSKTLPFTFITFKIEFRTCNERCGAHVHCSIFYCRHFKKFPLYRPRPLVLNRVDIPKIIVSQKKILFPNLFLAYPWYFLLQEAGLKEGFVFARSYHSADIVRGAKDFLEAESFINNHVKIKTLLYGTFSREWLNNLVV